MSELSLTRDLLTSIKKLVAKAQPRAASLVNAEMITLHRNVGRLIFLHQEYESRGHGVIPRLVTELTTTGHQSFEGVDNQLWHAQNQPTIGMISGQTKNRVLAENSLRDINRPIGVAGCEPTRVLPEHLASLLPGIGPLEAELPQDLKDKD
ncbi:hypothetical protein V2O64_25020 (plasmid) [Verrucomicrobiaceae bacterium 227]